MQFDASIPEPKNNNWYYLQLKSKSKFLLFSFFVLGLSNEPINLCLTRADIQDSDMMLLTLVVETTAIALSLYTFFCRNCCMESQFL